MKCPKCSYLGFETSDRCRNCGYDFSLLDAPPSEGDIDLALKSASVEDEAPSRWLEEVDRALGGAPEPVLPSPRPAMAAPARAEADPALPLFALERSRHP